jgi:hypothetical protein
MTATVSYEIHVMRGGRWVTSGIYQDKSDALRDARGSMRKRYVGIRVVEEIFDPERDRFVTRTIYRDNSRPPETASRGRDSLPAAGGAITMNDLDDDGGTSFGSLTLALLAVPAILLSGIAAMFWFGLV